MCTTAEWVGAKGQSWVRHQEALDRMLAPLMPTLLTAIDARPGGRILEVGCGCGALSLELAAAAGQGQVTCVDISPPMLGHARSRAEAADLEIDWIEADAQEHVFSTPFDRIVSRFGVMFFAEPGAAFGNLRGALAPDGRLVFLCWRDPRDNPWLRIPAQIAAGVVETPIEFPEGYQPGPFAFADRDFLGDLLRVAGFRDIAIDRHDVVLGAVGDTAEQIIDFHRGNGVFNRALAEADEPQRLKLLEALDAWVKGDVVTGAFQPEASCWLVTAGVS